jgi:histidinol dehydrogenase
MKIINDLNQAEYLLKRQAAGSAVEISSGMRASLKAMFGTENIEEAVGIIISDVRASGDAALLELTQKIDRVELKEIAVPHAELASASKNIAPDVMAALEQAAGRIRSFHRDQMTAVKSGAQKMLPGTVMRPLERVGLYVPGGRASYPSSVLMTAIPAQAAGVNEIVVCTPPARDGHVPALTLAAAYIAGVNKVFSIGGAQAIAAMAYGTRSVPVVDKICGPGNIFVMLAKKQVYGAVDIDGLQGPSEILVIADATASAADCAADMLAQAEHDTMAQCIMITTSAGVAEATLKEIESQLKSLERQAILRESLDRNGAIIVVDDIMQAIRLSNLYAPEHLCLMLQNAAGYIEHIRHAGCIFTGYRPTVVMGDYVAGPSHALPTSGTARFSSPLGVMDFVKYTNVVDIDAGMYQELGTVAQTLARAEGLTAHASAVKMRLEYAA